MKERKPEGEYNPHLRSLILQVVENQIAGVDEDGQPLTTSTDEPNYVKDTFDRLLAVHGAVKAKEMIASVLIAEMYDVMKYQ